MLIGTLSIDMHMFARQRLFTATTLQTALLVAAAVASCCLPAASWARHAYDDSLVPPPPPTPVLSIAPPPTVLPYSYAMSNFRPEAAAGQLTPEKLLPSMLSNVRAVGAPVPIPASYATALTAPTAGRVAPSASMLVPVPARKTPYLNPEIAKIRGYGSPRYLKEANGPGCAFAAAPPAAGKPRSAWSQACLSWYVDHERSQTAPTVDQPASAANFNVAFFQPAWPASLETADAVLPASLQAGSDPKTLPQTSASGQKHAPVSHKATFRHRHRTIAKR